MTRGARARVAIIDYQAGNLFSVRHACETVGLDPVITADPAVIADSAAAILPGVGAFGEAMSHLERLRLVPAIADFVASGRPFMGICLGLQLLFTESEEFGRHAGLGLVPGRVIRFANQDERGRTVRVPQIGWNQIHPADQGRPWTGTPLAPVAPGSYMYFVHSYYVVPDAPGDRLCVAHYGGRAYCAGVQRGNLFAVQFHPEKSAEGGLTIYRSWADGIH